MSYTDWHSMGDRCKLSNEPIDDLLGRIRDLYTGGPSPNYNPAYAKNSICPLCNRRQVSGLARINMKPLDGTNLCWGDCKWEADSTIPITDVIRIIEYFEDQIDSSHRVYLE